MLGRYKTAEELQGFIAKSPAEREQTLGGDAKTVLSDVRETRKNVQDGSLNLWDVQTVVDATMAGLGIGKDSPQRAKVKAKESAQKTKETVLNIALGVFSFGFGIAGAVFTGGASLAFAAGALGLGAYDAIKSTEDHFVKNAASNTDVDPDGGLLPAEAHQHWGWLVVAWAGVALDFAQGRAARRQPVRGREQGVRVVGRAEEARRPDQHAPRAAQRAAREVAARDRGQAALRKEIAFLENEVDIHSRVVTSLSKEQGAGFVAMSTGTKDALDSGERLPDFPDKAILTEDELKRSAYYYEKEGDKFVLKEKVGHKGGAPEPAGPAVVPPTPAKIEELKKALGGTLTHANELTGPTLATLEKLDPKVLAQLKNADAANLEKLGKMLAEDPSLGDRLLSYKNAYGALLKSESLAELDKALLFNRLSSLKLNATRVGPALQKSGVSAAELAKLTDADLQAIGKGDRLLGEATQKFRPSTADPAKLEEAATEFAKVGGPGRDQLRASVSHAHGLSDIPSRSRSTISRRRANRVFRLASATRRSTSSSSRRWTARSPRAGSRARRRCKAARCTARHRATSTWRSSSIRRSSIAWPRTSSIARPRAGSRTWRPASPSARFHRTSSIPKPSRRSLAEAIADALRRAEGAPIEVYSPVERMAHGGQRYRIWYVEPDGHVRKLLEPELAADGKYLRQALHGADGALISNSVYHYDDNGWLIEIVTHAPDGTVTGRQDA